MKNIENVHNTVNNVNDVVSLPEFTNSEHWGVSQLNSLLVELGKKDFTGFCEFQDLHNLSLCKDYSEGILKYLAGFESQYDMYRIYNMCCTFDICNCEHLKSYVERCPHNKAVNAYNYAYEQGQFTESNCDIVIWAISQIELDIDPTNEWELKVRAAERMLYAFSDAVNLLPWVKSLVERTGYAPLAWEMFTKGYVTREWLRTILEKCHFHQLIFNIVVKYGHFTIEWLKSQIAKWDCLHYAIKLVEVDLAGIEWVISLVEVSEHAGALAIYLYRTRRDISIEWVKEMVERNRYEEDIEEFEEVTGERIPLPI